MTPIDRAGQPAELAPGFVFLAVNSGRIAISPFLQELRVRQFGFRTDVPKDCHKDRHTIRPGALELCLIRYSFRACQGLF